MQSELFGREVKEFNYKNLNPAIIFEDSFVSQSEVVFYNLKVLLLLKDKPLFSYRGTVLFNEALLFAIQAGEETTYSSNFRLDTALSYLHEAAEANSIVLYKGDCRLELGCHSKFDFSRLREVLRPCVISRGFNQQFIKMQELGIGVSSEVFLAKSKQSGQCYAAKKIKKSYILAKENRYRQLVNEIKLHQKLRNCTAVVQLLEVVEDADNVYLIMETMKGGSLYDLLVKSKGLLTEAEVIHIMEQLLLSVDLLHQNKIAHRDLKLENILLKEEYNREQGFESLDIKLCDLGIALQLESEEEPNLICGTPGYIAPELLNWQSYGTKVDVFSAGVVMFQILTGRNLIDGKDLREVMTRNMQFEVESIVPLIAHYQEPIKELLIGILQQDQRQRLTAHEALTHSYFEVDNDTIQDALLLNKVFLLPPSRPSQHIIPKEGYHQLSHMSELIACLLEEEEEEEESKCSEEEEEVNIAEISIMPDRLLEQGKKELAVTTSVEDQEFFFMQPQKLGKEEREEKKVKRLGSGISATSKKDYTYGKLLHVKRNNSGLNLAEQPTAPIKHQKSSFFLKYLQNAKEEANFCGKRHSTDGNSLEVGEEFDNEDVNSKGIEEYCQEQYKLDFAKKKNSPCFEKEIEH